MSKPDPTAAVLAKIRKLLAKAEDPAATPEEADTYTAKAADLVASYGIDRALLAEEIPDSDVVGDRVVVMDAPYALDKATLLSSIAHALRCQAVRRVRHVGPRARKEVSIHLFGYDSDLFRVELLFTSLLLQATTRLAGTTAPPYESLAAYRRSWLAGFTAAVTQRLREAEDRAGRDAEAERECDGPGRAGARPEGRSVALVLVDRSRAVAAAVDEEYPHLRTASRRALSGSGGASGWAAGQRADLGGRPVGRDGRRQIAG
ncbi:MAG: DUF2786 domain-containing protein [Actinomycetes bacterium]